MRLLRNIAAVVVIVALLIGAWFWIGARHASGNAARYRTALIKRGDIIATIRATGTVEPEEVIDVGAQVAGRITEFGKDKAGKPIDYGSQVEEGTILALIDPSLYQSEVDQVDAQLKQAEAGVHRAEADLGQFTAKYNQAKRDWDRAQKLGPSDALAQVDYDAYQSAFESAKANVAVGEAALEQARRTVMQNDAALKRAQQNLGYCTIASPVKGVIIDRRVNIGQTVVASLSAPSLFLIAKDLKRMQVWVAVNEADIGSIKPGQPVSFTIDAFPGRMFTGSVSKVRLNATMTQNVVTYTVEVATDNSSGVLLPYLTANAQFEVNRHEGVLTVPNAALRWSPAVAQIAPDVRDEPEPQSERGRGAGERSASTNPAEERADHRPGTLWVADGEFVRPLKVMAGATDGSVTEVYGKAVEEGIEVAVGDPQTGQAAAGASGGAPSGSTNPFAPTFPRGGRRGGPR